MTRFIKINEIPDDGYNIIEQIPSSCVEQNSEFEINEPININFQIGKVKGEVIAKGDIQFSVKQGCSLCLDEFVSKIRSTFELEFKSLIPAIEESEIELEKEELNVVWLKGSEIDLFEIIREQVFLSIPMKPVCKAECLGLCLKCGSNLNINKCNCQTEKIDSRFAVLKNLKVRS